MEWSGKAFGGDNISADTWMKWRSESWWYLEEERPRQRTQHKRRLWGRNRHGLFQELWEGNVAGNRVKGERSGSKRCLRAGQGADNVGWITRRSLLTEQKTYIMVRCSGTGGYLRLEHAFGMPSLLPHDLCHRRGSSRWLPALVQEGKLWSLFQIQEFFNSKIFTELVGYS